MACKTQRMHLASNFCRYLLPLFKQGTVGTGRRMSQITAEELKKRLEAGDDLSVVDIRSEDAYETETIEGSQNLPLREALLDGDLDTVQNYLDEIPDDKEVVTFCDAGVASEQTAEMLSNQGHDAKALDGGLNSWKENDN